MAPTTGMGPEMLPDCRKLFGTSLAMAIAIAAMMPAAEAASERPLFVTLGPSARAPIGWVEFCVEHAQECDVKALEPRDVVLTQKAWKDLARINKWVNDRVKPM